MNFSSFSNLDFYNFLNFSCTFNKEVSLFLLGNYKKSQILLFPLSQISQQSDGVFIIGEIFSILKKELEDSSTRSHLFLENIFSQEFSQKEIDERSLLIKEKLNIILESPDITPIHKTIVSQGLRDELKEINRISYNREALFFYYSFLSLMKGKFKSIMKDFTELRLSYESLLRLKDILGEIPLSEKVYDEWFSILCKLQRSLRELSLLSDENFLKALKERLKEEDFNINSFYLIPYDNYEDSYKISLRFFQINKDIVDIYSAYQKDLKGWL